VLIDKAKNSLVKLLKVFSRRKVNISVDIVRSDLLFVTTVHFQIDFIEDLLVAHFRPADSQRLNRRVEFVDTDNSLDRVPFEVATDRHIPATTSFDDLIDLVRLRVCFKSDRFRDHIILLRYCSIRAVVNNRHTLRMSERELLVG
jgi:hypothetical protein